jgi:glycosyltransferase involved in cell wall biosynthesis
MATYNGERYLARQLASIGGQTRQPDELVVGDDGSVDRTVEIVTSFRESAPFPVKLILRDRTGIAANFLLSLEASEGDLVAFADQDDVWLPEKLERSVAALRHQRADVVIHGRRTVDAELRPVLAGYVNVGRLRVEDRLRGNVWEPGAGNAMLLRRSVLDGCDWTARPMSEWSEDPVNHDDLVKLLASVRGRTVRLPDRLVLYRQHGGNVAGAAGSVVDQIRKFTGRRAYVERVEHRARVARDWAEYFSALVVPDYRLQTIAYFRDAGQLMSARAKRLQSPAWRAIPSVGAAAMRGEYSSRSTGGFGWRSLLRDAYSFYDPGARHRPWRIESHP